MSDWKYYSPAHKLPSAGDLLRAIPSRRNLRLERIVTDGTEESYEAVRAAESLFGLSVRMRLLNDPSGAMTLTIRDATDADREEFAGLGQEAPEPDDVAVYVEISLHDSAIEAGHVALADDVLCGIESVFGKGVAWSPLTDEVFVAGDIATMMASEKTPWTHVDVRLEFDPDQLEYVSSRLSDELPEAMARLMRVSEEQIQIAGRFPAQLDDEQYQKVWTTLLETAPFARRGYIRFREQGTWSDVVEGIGSGDVADVPDEWAASRRGLRGVISRLLGR